MKMKSLLLDMVALIVYTNEMALIFKPSISAHEPAMPIALHGEGNCL
jgi:hypothetical protein